VWQEQRTLSGVLKLVSIYEYNIAVGVKKALRGFSCNLLNRLGSMTHGGAVGLRLLQGARYTCIMSI